MSSPLWLVRLKFAYDTIIDGEVMWEIVGGENDGLGALVPGSETRKSKLKVNPEMLEQVEIREGDTYTMCDTNGDPVETTIHQIHLSLKSSNKPDFTFTSGTPRLSIALTAIAMSVLTL